MTTRAELGILEASGLVQVAAMVPELEYLFRHALVQDAAYSSLLKQDRRALHRLAAEKVLNFNFAKARSIRFSSNELRQARDSERGNARVKTGTNNFAEDISAS